MYKITSRWGHQNSVSVMWNIGKRCNYDCSYCPSEIHDLSSMHTDINLLKNTVDQLSVLNNPVRIMFTGGEPTQHPDFIELLQYIKNKNIQWTSITTNGTKSSVWYLQNEIYWDHLLFSLHFEHNWEYVLNTIEKYNSQTTKNFFVNVMAHHEHMDDVRYAVDRFDTVGIKYAIRRIRWIDTDRDNFNDNLYSESDLSWIMCKESTADSNCLINDEKLIHANDIIKNHQNNFTGWTCNAGIESLMINGDGEVYRATCKVGGSIGNIYSNTCVIPDAPIICTRAWCTCAADIYITKVNKPISE